MEQQVTAPAYSGITRDGASVSITAKAVRPRAGDDNMLEASTVAGRIELRAGASADMTARMADLPAFPSP